jgi:hypothetical protein
MTEFNKRLVLKAAPLLITVPCHVFRTVLPAEATVVTNLRLGNNNGYVRMVLEFDRPLIPPPSLSLLRDTIQVTLAGILNEVSPSRIGEEYSDGIVSIDISKMDGRQRVLTLSFLSSRRTSKPSRLTGPHRFIVDAYRPAPLGRSREPSCQRNKTGYPSIDGITRLRRNLT